MKIAITGSLGHISKPLTQGLIQNGHTVTVISSNAGKQKDIEALGAAAAIGSVEDIAFLTNTFKGEDAVYCMVPPGDYFNHSFDPLAYYNRLGNNYAEAIVRAGVPRVVNLSSIGAHLEKGSGLLVGAYDVEQILNRRCMDVAITHMRPVAFYYNLFGYANTIKTQGIIAANYGGDDLIPWVSPDDIAAAIADEITMPLTGIKVRYVSSDERTGNDTAAVLGAAIGKPDLKWIVVTDEQMLAALESVGMNPKVAAGLTEMYSSLRSGLLSEDYYSNLPAKGEVKLEAFAKEFAAVYNQQ